MTNDEPEQAAPEFHSEIEHGHEEYTVEELLEQSQMNAQAWILGVFDTFRDDQESMNRLTDGIAQTFLRGWDATRAWEPVEILDALLTNYRSMGADIDAYDPDEESPIASLAELPNADLVEQLAVSSTAFRPMLMVSERLVNQLGCELEWSHDAAAGRIRLQVNRKS